MARARSGFQAAYIASKVCEGLDYAHRKKDARGRPMEIVHRESKTGLFSSELRSLKSKGFDQRDSGPATTIQGMQYELLGKRRRSM